MFAPAHHPAMKHAGPVRRELAARTVFNVLGPLTNPAGARAQVVGVYSPLLVPVIADVLAQLGARRAFVVHGAGGIDELSPAGPNLVCEVVDGDVRRREIDPLELGIPRCDPDELRGGDRGRERARRSARCSTGANGGPPLGDPAQRRRRDRRRRPRRRPARRASQTRRRESARLAAPRPRRGSTQLVAFSQAERCARDEVHATRSRRPGSARSRSSSGARRRPATCGPDGDVAAGRARATSAGGARAMSVLVDERFGGSWDDLRAARAATTLPLLAKGFFSTPEHLARGARGRRRRGAAPPARPRRRRRRSAACASAATLGLDTLVEAHDADELARAVALDAPVIGVNARDLSTFAIDRARAARAASRARRATGS